VDEAGIEVPFLVNEAMDPSRELRLHTELPVCEFRQRRLALLGPEWTPSASACTPDGDPGCVLRWFTVTCTPSPAAGSAPSAERSHHGCATPATRLS
jgi:hypothetical protein